MKHPALVVVLLVCLEGCSAADLARMRTHAQWMDRLPPKQEAVVRSYVEGPKPDKRFSHYRWKAYQEDDLAWHVRDDLLKEAYEHQAWTAEMQEFEENDRRAQNVTAPKPRNDREMAEAKKYFERVLKDPMSARIRYVNTTKDWWNIYRDRQTHFGWVSRIGCNAKNSYGAYAGESIYLFCWKGSEVQLIIDSEDETLHRPRYENRAKARMKADAEPAKKES